MVNWVAVGFQQCMPTLQAMRHWRRICKGKLRRNALSFTKWFSFAYLITHLFKLLPFDDHNVSSSSRYNSSSDACVQMICNCEPASAEVMVRRIQMCPCCFSRIPFPGRRMILQPHYHRVATESTSSTSSMPYQKTASVFLCSSFSKSVALVRAKTRFCRHVVHSLQLYF